MDKGAEGYRFADRVGGGVGKDGLATTPELKSEVQREPIAWKGNIRIFNDGVLQSPSWRKPAMAKMPLAPILYNHSFSKTRMKCMSMRSSESSSMTDQGSLAGSAVNCRHRQYGWRY